ncbi:KH domain-containing protein [Patescibacteria group bacterium]|nr:KH domain-containing protein [Patescibacteria group bacterium]
MKNEEIKNTIETFLEKMTIPFDDVECIETNLHSTFLVHSSDAGILIGVKGETLEALGYLIRRVVEKNNTEDDRSVFIVDVNNYQTKKIQELIDSAQASARRVKLFKQSVELSPMTSYERMLIHSLFTDDKEITTTSYGDGKFRRIVLQLQGVENSEEVV